ncbi:MAG: hypothetical protein ACTSU9_11555 [Promethearchaeota archaeon]
MFGNGGFGGMPFDFDSIINQLKENIDVFKEEDGIIIIFKQMMPGMNLEMMKGMIENMMNSKKMGMLSSMFSGDQEDDDDGEAEFNEKFGIEDDDDAGPGFSIEVLPSDNGFKLIPDNPMDIDEMFESINNLFDPELFKKMMEQVMEMMKGLMGGFFGGMGGENPDEDDEFEDKGDSTSSGDYFYT